MNPQHPWMETPERGEVFIPGRGRARSMVIWDELVRAHARTAARQATERRKHARKAARAAIRRLMP